MPIEQPKPAAPYLPFKTFLNSGDVFSQGIPPRIHRSLWRQSGLIQGQLMSAYRFFGLIDDEDKPTPALEKFAKAPVELRPTVVGEMLKAGYPDIMAHDLTTTTIPILHELIEKYNVGGATKKKAVTFFLQAAKYANVPLSSFIQTRSSGPRKRRSRNGEDHFTLPPTPPPAPPKVGQEKRLELNSGGSVTLTVDVDFLSISDSDRKFVFELVDKLAGYAPSLGATMRRAYAKAEAS